MRRIMSLSARLKRMAVFPGNPPFFPPPNFLLFNLALGIEMKEGENSKTQLFFVVGFKNTEGFGIHCFASIGIDVQEGHIHE